jgi:hypothetical protein
MRFVPKNDAAPVSATTRVRADGGDAE